MGVFGKIILMILAVCIVGWINPKAGAVLFFVFAIYIFCAFIRLLFRKD